MAYKLPTGKLIRLKIAYVDNDGNPASVDGDVTWGTSNPAIATVEADALDSTMSVVSSVGIGTGCQINATADADLGEGTRELVTLFDLDVVGGEAVAGTISPSGEPEDIEPHPAPV